MCGLRGSRRDNDTEFVVVDDMAVGAGEWRERRRYCLGDLVVSDRSDGFGGGTSGQKAPKECGDVGIVPNGVDIGGLEYRKAGFLECSFE
jgi:hypothetical protein